MEILYTCDDFLVCVKPVGMDSEKEVPAALGGNVYPLHRLDRNVGGIMIYARKKPAAAALSEIIARGQMEKEYIAMVHGTPPEQGEYTDLLFKDSRKNKVFVVKKLRTGVREAKLSFTRLAAGERSLMRIRLHTGRSHQIRVQFASRGFPLVGDHKYGSRAAETAPMLYCCCLRFSYQGKPYEFELLPSWAKNDL